MTPQREEAIYKRLEQLTLTLDMQTERGPTYLMDKLLECRRLQDETVQLLNEVRKARAQMKIHRRSQAAILSLQPTDLAARAAYRDAEDRYDALTALEGCVNSIRRNLSSTDSDIRLGAKLVEHQLKLGAITPSAAAAVTTELPGVVPAPIELPDIAPVETLPFTAPPEPPPAPVTEEQLASLFAVDPVPVGAPGAGRSSIASIEAFLSTGEMQ